jgi:hypothetical protein
LNAISFSRTPEHIIKVKSGMPVVVTHNMNFNGGIFSGNWMMLEEINCSYLKGILTTGLFCGGKIILP